MEYCVSKTLTFMSFSWQKPFSVITKPPFPGPMFIFVCQYHCCSIITPKLSFEIKSLIKLYFFRYLLLFSFYIPPKIQSHSHWSLCMCPTPDQLRHPSHPSTPSVFSAYLLIYPMSQRNCP